jgi:hypothetical protein
MFTVSVFEIRLKGGGQAKREERMHMSSGRNLSIRVTGNKISKYLIEGGVV